MMKSRHYLLILGGLIIVVILAFYLQDVVRQAVVTPISYLWWLLKLAYPAIPQLLLWILLLAVLFLAVVTNLVNWFTPGKKFEERAKPAKGNVEILAGWIINTREGNYYKWLIANRLGKLWVEMSGRLENRGRVAGLERQSASGRQAPETVKRYLQAGMEESFVDYPLPRPAFIRKQATPFDLDVEEAVDFLESQMEGRSGKKHP
jgi:energy-coupling factor transporter transmembrane protein EcfT